MKNASCRSIAEKLNISPKTVYRVLDNSAPVRPTTRRKVIDALNRNGYFTQKMISNQVIALDMPVSPTAYNYRIINGMMRNLSSRNYRYIVTSHQNDWKRFEDAVTEAEIVIWGTYPSAEEFDRGKKINPDATHIMLLNGGDRGDISLDSDDFLGGRLAAQHLAANGHRKILVASPVSWSRNHMDRYISFTAEIKRIAPATEIVLLEQREQQLSYELVRDFVEDGKLNGITAVFCTHGMLTHDFMHVFRRYGIKVPGDISLLGYDYPEDVGYTPLFKTDMIYYNIESLVRWLEYFILNRPLLDCSSGIHALVKPILHIQGSIKNITVS